MATVRQLFLNHLAQTSPAPLQIEVHRAEGVFLYGPDGQSWIDMIAGIGMSPIGYCHPEVVKSVKEQAEKYMHVMVYGEYVLAPQVKFAEALTRVLPDGLDNVYLVNSGTEATEGAMKLAKRYTGRWQMVSCANAYHGSTQGAMSLMSDDYYTQAYRPLIPGIRHIGYNSFEDLEKIDTTVAGVVLETIQAESGITIPNPAWLKALRARCTEAGALLILDEIQCGYGKTGNLWAFQGFDIVPDILLLGKAMGGGMPIAAFIASKEIMQTLSHNPVLGHITTFGGHPVCCAAASSTLEVLLRDQLIDSVAWKSQLFVDLLGKHPAVKEIRRAGLLMALDLGDPQKVQEVIAKGLQNGLIADWFLFNMSSIRLSPSLSISEEEIKEGCKRLLACLDEL
jgi:acetylornithine/succinyldiaminopimelate/putrescine aminotransferase